MEMIIQPQMYMSILQFEASTIFFPNQWTLCNCNLILLYFIFLQPVSWDHLHLLKWTKEGVEAVMFEQNGHYRRSRQ